MYILYLLIACSDGGIKHVDATPTATITWPTDGATLDSGDIELTGTVGDGDDDVSSLAVRWTVDGTEVCSGADAAGDTSCVAALEAGGHTIVLSVADPDGASDTSTVGVTISAGSAPVVTILSPAADDTPRVGDAVTFSGRVTDAEDAPGDLLVEWQDETGTVLDIPCVPDATGLCETRTTLETAGSQTFCLVATDTSANISATCVILDVAEGNRAPECTISAPLDGAFAEVDTLVALDGTVSDADGDRLVAEWTDNGVRLASSEVDGAGELVTSSVFDAGAHVLTLSATDPAGASCSGSVTLRAGDAPVVSIESPIDGTVYGETDPVPLSGAVADSEDAPGTLDLVWASDVDGVLDTTPADASGNVYAVVGALSPGAHHLTLTALDSDGLSDSDSVDVVVDQAPNAPGVSIGPSSPGTDADLVVTIGAPSVDPEGDSISYRYDWYRGGVHSSASTSAILPASATTRGDVWSVEVTASDGFADGAPGTASTTVVNTTPAVTGVSITPDPASESDLLTCGWSYSDADGDTDVSTVSWTVDGALAGTGSTLVGAFVFGDVVVCTVTPSDGITTGSAGSDTNVIGNSGPVVTSLSLTPSDPQTDDAVTATVTGFDPDGGTLYTSWAWTVNGASVAETSDTLDGAVFFSRGDTVGVTVTLSDGLSSATDATSLTVRNTAPTLAAASIRPDPAFVGDPLTCATVGYADADGDTEATTYAWTVNGASAGSRDTLTTALTAGDVVVCTATSSDGTDSSPSRTDSVTIGNTPPVVSSVSLSPSSPTTDSTLTASASTSDLDGDSVTLAYAWTVNGLAVSPTTSTLSGTWFSKSDVVRVSVTPSDAWGTGAALASGPVTVLNSAPSVSAVSITPDPATATDALSCGWSFADADGDTDASTVSWTVDGTFAGTGRTLGGMFVGGDAVTCTVTPFDGTATGLAGSDTNVIGNSGPEVTSLSLTPSSPRTNDLLSATATGFDPDGGALYTTWAWTVDGAPVPETGDTLDGAVYFSRGDTVTVTVNISDGSSSATDTTSVTVRNTAPTLTGASIGPSPAHAGDTLTCSTVGYADADADPDSPSYAWTVNGLAAGSRNVLDSAVVGGDVVTCTATSSDGADASPSRTASVTVANTSPVVSFVDLSPPNPVTDSTLTVATSASDADGDGITLAYAWTVNGLGVAPTTSTLAGTWFAKHDVVRVTVTPSDADGPGTAVTSSPVTVVNSAPAAPVVAIPEGPIEGLDDLVCGIDVPGTDADGDAISYSATWTDDGVAYTSATTSAFLHDTVPGVATTAAETWTCTVTPNDGEANGATGSTSVDVYGEPVDYAHVQYPCTMSLTAGSPGTVYGWVYMAGITDAVGRGTPIEAEVGYGPDATLPMVDPRWVWSAASYNSDKDAYYPGDHANDEYAGTLTAPSTPGSYDYAYRFTTDGGLSWVYADLGGDTCALLGTTDGYQSATAGALTVY